MNTLDALMTRRSIRKFKPTEIFEEHIETMLNAAMHAPSARNKQPWSFIVVKDERKRKAIANASPFAAMVKEAPLAIVVCGDVSEEGAPEFWVQDCSAATQNILLAARELNIGSVWIGVYPKEDRVQGIKEIFNIPEHIQPLCVIALGYPDQDNPEVDRYNPAKIIHETY